MILRAKEESGILIFELEGQLDFESTQEFERTATTLLEQHKAENMVLNCSKLRFVGSSGIAQFIDILKHFSKTKKAKTKFCNLSAEFTRMFRVYQTARRPFEVYTDEQEAIASFDTGQSPRRPLKKKLLDN